MNQPDQKSSTPPLTETPISKVPTEIRGLDDILQGGFPSGRTTMINGGPGTGKTILAMEFLYRAALKHNPGVFVSFEERTNDLCSNMASFGMNLTELEQNNQLKIIHAEIPHRAVHSGEFDIQGLLAIVEGHTRTLNANLLVLDAIDVLMKVFGDVERERKELYILHDRLRKLRLTTLMTAKTNPDGIQIYPFLDFMTDCVLILDQRMTEQVRTRRLNVVKYRGSDFLSNEYPYVISNKGIVMMSISSLTLNQTSSEQQLASGHPKLDQILNGGYYQGSSILISGPSGSGKTTLASSFAFQACKANEKVLYVNFEQAENIFFKQMRNIGLDLQPYQKNDAFRLLTLFPESFGLETHLFWILEEIAAHVPHHVVIDTLSALPRIGSDQAAFGFFIRLLTACKNKGITCLFTKQHTSPLEHTSVSNDTISSMIDTLIALQYADDGFKLGRRLLVIKSRGANHSLQYHPWTITPHGIEFNGITHGTNPDQILENQP